MPTKGPRAVEVVTGHGQVWTEGKPISTVYYRIQVDEEFVVIGDQDIPGFNIIQGTIRVLRGDQGLFFVETALTLHLEDGRLLPFLVRQMDASSDVLHITATGAFAPEGD